MNCPTCDNIVAIDPADYDEKIKSHMLWYHPTEEQFSRLLVELYLHTQAAISHTTKERYIEASFVLNDLADKVLRMKKYVDMKLENE